MHWEVEQKYRIDDVDSAVASLMRLGVGFFGCVTQVDDYFRHPARDFAQTDEALRLRQVGEESFLTYKGPKIDPHSKTRRELELPLPAGADVKSRFAEMLAALGFLPAGTVKKVRRSGKIEWAGHAVEVAVDEVEQLGGFVELEISADNETVDSAKAALLDLARRLGLTSQERRSYLELVLEKCS